MLREEGTEILRQAHVPGVALCPNHLDTYNDNMMHAMIGDVDDVQSMYG